MKTMTYDNGYRCGQKALDSEEAEYGLDRARKALQAFETRGVDDEWDKGYVQAFKDYVEEMNEQTN